jgi:hypothetical protein
MDVKERGPSRHHCAVTSVLSPYRAQAVRLSRLFVQARRRLSVASLSLGGLARYHLRQVQTRTR